MVEKLAPGAHPCGHCSLPQLPFPPTATAPPTPPIPTVVPPSPHVQYCGPIAFVNGGYMGKEKSWYLLSSVFLPFQPSFLHFVLIFAFLDTI